MANPNKGEFSFEAGGASYTLRFSANALCDLEAQLGCATADIIPQLMTPRYSLIRAMLWAGLNELHPSITLKQAGEIIDALGGLAEAMIVLTKAFTLAFPDASTEAETKDARPPIGAGTGPDSIRDG